jgi:hypothetical protein
MADIEFQDEGTVTLIIPLSPAGKSWLDENVESEDWQYLGSNLAIDTRVVGVILAGASHDGLFVQEAGS